jgi:hypothetical protein
MKPMCENTPYVPNDFKCDYMPPKIKMIEVKIEDGKYFVRPNGECNWLQAEYDKVNQKLIFSY